MTKRIKPKGTPFSYRNKPTSMGGRKDQHGVPLSEYKKRVPWAISGLTYKDLMLCVGWVVLKYCLYAGEEWGMMKHERELGGQYRELMKRATKNDKQTIGTMANIILELGGYTDES